MVLWGHLLDDHGEEALLDRVNAGLDSVGVLPADEQAQEAQEGSVKAWRVVGL